MTQTTQNQSPTTLNMDVSQSILKKAPRFFGSPQSILTELFQNSFRAGAKTVTVDWNKETRVLQFKDDGCGCKPEDLIVVGESGWEEDSFAVDPAGIGAFSILRPEYCEQVTYRSCDWGMVRSAENLERGQVDVYHFDEQAEGMTIEIVLTHTADFVSQGAVALARGRYPMDVYWVATPKQPEVVNPYDLLNRGLWSTLKIKGVGTLEIGKHCGMFDTQYVLWQQAVMKSETFEKALRKAAQAHSKLADGIFRDVNLVLTIDPISGIRPKLPDRNDLIGDVHLDKACQKIVKTVMQHILKPLRPGLWPDRVGNYDFEPKGVNDEHLMSPLQAIYMEVPKDAMIKKLLQDAWGVPQLIMENYGYKAIVWDHMQSYNVCTVQDDGYQIEIEWDQVMNFIRNVPVMVVDSELVAESLCNQGIYAYVDAKSTTEVVYKNLVITPNHMVAFAKEITVNGTPVSWLLYDSEARMGCSRPQQEDPIFITTLSPLEFYKSIDRQYPDHDLYVGLVVWMLKNYCDIYEYATFEDSGDYMVETGDIADELLQNALKIGAPELVRMDEVRNALSELAELLGAARRKLRDAKEYMQRIADSDEKNPLGNLLHLVWDFSESTTMVFDAVDELNNSTSEAVQRLSQEVDTAFLTPPTEGK
ncbi:MAG TPA: ATP-binding protein [Anaerolineales bacterium]|nr:ATP-binding protein [Anaerolineales bacterium]